jgi:hypothetical protein
MKVTRLEFTVQCLDFCEPGSSVSIMSEYGLDGWAIEVRCSEEAKEFSFNLLCPDPHWGPAHPASCIMGTGGPFSWTKARLGRDADHSPPSSAEVENE